MKYHLAKWLIYAISPFGFVYGAIAIGFKAGAQMGARYVYQALDKKPTIPQ